MVIIWKAPTKMSTSLMKHANGGVPAKLNAAIMEEVAVDGIFPAKPPMSRMFRVASWLFEGACGEEEEAFAEAMSDYLKDCSAYRYNYRRCT